ncbi:hypothetical protein QFC22_004693 [Naganishia vaughanmartiniae]|uniref:Uncharacterized protein n=1 Tax=Naganishia vaughanmartiniae TaxID=1424756 RepID=A0ACC2X0V5_9TREE|nr:hypothetical protein QFC22_004693 [Naganishia vaughanmartiniae]
MRLDISKAAQDMDSSADEGTPDAAPGPAPATGFTEKHQEPDTGEMEIKMKTTKEADEAAAGGNEDGSDAGGNVRRRRKGVVSSLLGNRNRKYHNADRSNDDSGEVGPRRARRRPSLKILRKRRRWEEGALFSRSMKNAGATSGSETETDSGGSESSTSEDTSEESDIAAGYTSEEDDRRRRHHPVKSDRRQRFTKGNQIDDYNLPRGLASASSSRRSSSTTLTDHSKALPSSRRSSQHDLASRASHTSDRSSLRSRDPRHIKQVRQARRAMKEDLNEPYIPAYRSGHTDPTNPGSSLKLNQYWDSALRFVRLRSRGMSTEEAEEKGVQTGQYRSIAALIIATSGLVGPAAPRLAHLAPASGRDAETSKGQRKLAEYTNPREKSAKAIMDMTEDARAEAQEMGVPLDSKEKVDLANEALMKVDKQRGKGKPLRGRRHQREIKITKHISDVMERQEFIEHLAKALIK